MRVSYKPEEIGNEKDEVVGFYFDNGHCAEHEWGIDDLKKSFKINDSILGTGGRKVNIVPDNLALVEYTEKKIERICLFFSRVINLNEKLTIADKKKVIENISGLKTKSLDNTEWLSAAWSDNDFCIYGAGKKYVEIVKKLYNAFVNLDIIMFVGNLGNNPFNSGGLIFMIESMLKEDYKQIIYNHDVSERKLKKAAAPILKKLKKAGKEYYACSPDWADDEETTLRFFLNPRDQRNNYWGWVSKQDLLDWTKNKGVIPGHGLDFERSKPEEYKKLEKEINAKIGLM